MNTVCIVQARMDSSRFPGKVLEEIAGHTLLDHVVSRGLEAGLPAVVATTDRPIDDPIAAWAVTHQKVIPVFRWGGKGQPSCAVPPEQNVLGRYLACARAYAAEAIVRLTGDAPFVPVDVIRIVAADLESGSEVACMTSGNGHVPDGWEAEGCIVEWLSRVNSDMPTRFEREHVFPGIYNRLKADSDIIPEESPSKWSDPWLLRQKFSVDTPADLDRLRWIAEHVDCTPPGPVPSQLIQFLQAQTEIRR